ncbi:hypothetical protein [Actinoplanes sp. NPDC051859]|uniref:hypothetical protein n=1 Tax=Actinoplanes sp. NPDC051859 TaxID=3363909 RepID=UPI00379FE19D
MTTFQRWRIAVPLAAVSAILLGATVLGAWAYWADDSLPRRAMTVFLGLMFGVCLASSLSIGFDRKLTDVPWLRIATVAALVALACGVSWVRDML